jgi:hypothetical protein
MTQGSDTFGGAPLISVGETSDATPTVGLSMEPGEPTYTGVTMSRSAWWKFTAPRTTDVSLNLFHSEGVASWQNDASFTRLAVYTGTSLSGLTVVDSGFGSDQLTDLAYAPELLVSVTAGMTYRVQAMTRDTYPDFSYRLQVAEYVETVTDWIQEPDFEWSPPRHLDSDGNLVNGVNGDAKMWDALDPTIFSPYVDNPNIPVLLGMIEAAKNNAHDNGSGAWSSEAVTLYATVGSYMPIGGAPFFPVDPTMINYGAAYREFTYGFRKGEVLLRHQYLPEVPPESGAYWYEWEPITPDGPDRSSVQEATVTILIETDSSEGTELMTPIKPAACSYRFQVRTSSTEALPPMPEEVSNDNAAIDLSTWGPGGDLVVAETGFGDEETSLHTIHMTLDEAPLINTDGAFVLAGWTTEGVWGPPSEQGYNMRLKAQLVIADIVYTVRPPRRRWLIREYITAVASIPYRRIIPARGDGLAGGARRTYPPIKAQQSGKRNVGGYW